MREIAEKLKTRFTNTEIAVFPIRNDFFGETVTVSGLTVGGDLIAQLQPRKSELGSRLIIPKCMLKADEDIFLDDVTLEQVCAALELPVIPVGEEPQDLIAAVTEG